MLWFLPKRLLSFAATLFLAACLAYFTVPVADQVAEYGGFIPFLSRMLRGDWGLSAASESISALIGAGLAVSLPIYLAALLASLAAGLGLGMLADKVRSSVGHAVLVLVLALAALTPVAWLALMLLLAFGVGLGWLAPDAGVLRIVLTIAAATLPTAALIGLWTQSKLGDIRESPWFRAALTRGLSPEQAMWRHGFRHALLPTMRTAPWLLTLLLAACLIAERALYVEGLAQMLFEALSARDGPLLQALVIVIAGLAALVRLLAGLAGAAIDPPAMAGRPA